MNHDFAHCTGVYYSADDALDCEKHQCPRRNLCKRHIASEELINDMDSLPEGTQINFLSAAECMILSYEFYINDDGE